MHRILPFAALLLPLPAQAQFQPGRVTIEHCAPCHGRDGVAPDSEVPHLAGQNERYLFNQLMAFRTGGAPASRDALHGPRADGGRYRGARRVLRLTAAALGRNSAPRRLFSLRQPGA